MVRVLLLCCALLLASSHVTSYLLQRISPSSAWRRAGSDQNGLPSSRLSRSLAAHLPRSSDGSPDLKAYWQSLTVGEATAEGRREAENGVTEVGSSSGGGGPGASSNPEPVQEEVVAEGDIKGIKLALLRLAAQADRGRLLGPSGRGRARVLIEKLERGNPTEEPAQSTKLTGRWSLVYAEDDATRSSPFFWAFRKALAGIKDPRDSSVGLSEAIFAVTDSIPFKEVGPALQTIDLDKGTLVSEVQVIIGTKPFSNRALFPYAESLMTTTSSIQPIDGRRLELTVKETRVRDSTLQKALPAGLLPLDEWAFPLDKAFAQLSPYNNTVAVEVTYLDDDMRVVRDPDGRPFIYTRTT